MKMVKFMKLFGNRKSEFRICTTNVNIVFDFVNLNYFQLY